MPNHATAMPANELIALADRVEALDGPDRGVFVQAFAAFYGRNPDRRRLEHIDYKFLRMLDAEAWTSAAEMLVPAGAIWSAETWDDNGIYPPHVLATAWVCGAKRVYAATPALALLAASLRARAGMV